MTGTAERPQGEIAPTGRKGTFDRRRLSKVLLRYFRESNKAYVPYPALILQKDWG